MRSNKNKNLQPKIVVIGGGTGTSVVLSGLKAKPLDLTAIIAVSDSGGSTGRLRDEFGFLPVGDLRQSLAALARQNHQSWIKELLLYRFSTGKELKGHNLGNLILTALQDMAGGTPAALELASKIFRLDGRILPSTLKNVQLVTTYTDGTKITGEHHLDDKKYGGKKIKSIKLKPSARLYSKAADAIKAADLVVIGPGDVYASILPNLIVKRSKSTFAQTKAKIVYIVNLMTRYTQTHEFKASDHINVISQALGKQPDAVILNTGKIPKKVRAAYNRVNEYVVEDDLKGSDIKVLRGNYISTHLVKQSKHDPVRRSHLRHDQNKLTQAIIKLIK